MTPLAAARSAGEVLAWSRGVVDPALRKAVDTIAGPLRRVAGYHLGWWDEDGNPADVNAGKAIRPALTLLTAEAVGGNDPESALAAAVAVELVHNFSLLHDDVMDGDLTRRHRRTAWSVFGRRYAILTGDALVTVAFDVLSGCGHPSVQTGLRMLSGAVLDLLHGQYEDLAFERREDVDLAECLHMAESKTGALLRCSCALGAVFGGGTPDQVARLGDFGRRLGLAFQHSDDLLGIWGDPAATGKPVYSDLDNRKKSLPVVAALASDTAAAGELAELYRRESPLSTDDLVHAAELVDQAGGRDWSQAQAAELLTAALTHLRSADPVAPAAAELLTAALTHLRSADPVAPAAAELTALASLIIHRDH